MFRNKEKLETIKMVFKILFHVYEHFVWTYVCAPPSWLVVWRPEEGILSPEAGDSCKFPVWEPNLGLQQEQRVASHSEEVVIEAGKLADPVTRTRPFIRFR